MLRKSLSYSRSSGNVELTLLMGHRPVANRPQPIPEEILNVMGSVHERHSEYVYPRIGCGDVRVSHRDATRQCYSRSPCAS